MTEIRTQELRFNKAETAAFLTQELGTQVDLATADALEEKTEGWVTGLRLAVLSMRQRGHLDQIARAAGRRPIYYGISFR